MKTDEQIYEEYMRSQGLLSVDIGSVASLRKEVNNQLTKKGYRRLKGYKSKNQLKAILAKQ